MWVFADTILEHCLRDVDGYLLVLCAVMVRGSIV